MTSVRFSVETYSDCRDEVREFHNAVRGTRRDAAYFAWRYEQRPCPDKAVVVWASTSNGERVGLWAAIPQRFHVVDREAVVAVTGDLSVATEFRGRGIARELVATLAQAGCFRDWRGAFGLPNESAAGVKLRAGWVVTDSLTRRVRIIRSSPERPVWLRALLFAGSSLWRGGRPHRGSPRHVVVGTTFDDRFDALWERFERRDRVIAVRNGEFLRWRFARHPNLTFQILELLREGSLEAYLVWRSEGATVIVDDLLAVDNARASDLLVALIYALRERGDVLRLVIQIGATSIPDLRWGSFGLLRRRDQQLATWISAGRATASDPAVRAHWYVTAADKDV